MPPLLPVCGQLRLPQSIKLKLIEDWERITREKKLVRLASSRRPA